MALVSYGYSRSAVNGANALEIHCDFREIVSAQVGGATVVWSPKSANDAGRLRPGKCKGKKTRHCRRLGESEMIEIPLQKLPHQEFSIVLDGQNCVLELRQMGSFLYLTLTADEVKICDSHACQSGEPIPVWNTPLFSGRLFFQDGNGKLKGAAVRRTQRSIHSLLRDGRRMAGTYSLKGHQGFDHARQGWR